MKCWKSELCSTKLSPCRVFPIWFLTEVVNFLILAAALFLLIKALNAMMKSAMKGGDEEAMKDGIKDALKE